jgi:hypothetical protein
MKRKNNLDEVQHIEASFSFLLLDEAEVLQTCFPLVHEDEEVITLDDIDDIKKDLSDMVDIHIDDFIQAGRRRWDFDHFTFDKDPIYDIEGISLEKGFELSSSKNGSSHAYDSYVLQPSDDMITDLFHPFKDDLLQRIQSDLHFSLYAYSFKDAYLFYEKPQPLCSYFEEYHDVATS